MIRSTTHASRHRFFKRATKTSSSKKTISLHVGLSAFVTLVSGRMVNATIRDRYALHFSLAFQNRSKLIPIFASALIREGHHQYLNSHFVSACLRDANLDCQIDTSDHPPLDTSIIHRELLVDFGSMEDLIVHGECSLQLDDTHTLKLRLTSARGMLFPAFIRALLLAGYHGDDIQEVVNAICLEQRVIFAKSQAV
ncbi:hypothetical protein [Enterovibrio norvegicus]|uniref:hypothetical protein n=1 Tax=Enterovibrio norvegicus TaxID=188144 RepID=UPI00352E8F14